MGAGGLWTRDLRGPHFLHFGTQLYVDGGLAQFPCLAQWSNGWMPGISQVALLHVLKVPNKNWVLTFHSSWMPPSVKTLHNLRTWRVLSHIFNLVDSPRARIIFQVPVMISPAVWSLLLYTVWWAWISSTGISKSCPLKKKFVCSSL